MSFRILRGLNNERLSDAFLYIFSTSNHKQPQATNMNKQMELPVLADCSYPIKELKEQEVAKCSNQVQAYRMCVNNSIVIRTHQTWSELLGVSRSYFTQMLNADTSDKPRYMPPEIEQKLMRLAGNKAPIQWRQLELEGRLHCQVTADQRREQLLAELAELDAKSA